MSHWKASVYAGCHSRFSPTKCLHRPRHDDKNMQCIRIIFGKSSTRSGDICNTFQHFCLSLWWFYTFPYYCTFQAMIRRHSACLITINLCQFLTSILGNEQPLEHIVFHYSCGFRVRVTICHTVCASPRNVAQQCSAIRHTPSGLLVFRHLWGILDATVSF